MLPDSADDHIFEKENYSDQIITNREFQSCTFYNCDFTDSNFSLNKLLDCTFESCNFSNANLKGTTLSNAQFRNCKILGVNFHECESFLFEVGFDASILDYSSFMGRKMPKTKFIRTSLKEVNFSRTNLAGSVFDQTDLAGTIFDETDLSACNLKTAFNYIIDPQLNKVKKATFGREGIVGLLSKYDIKII
jgi:fluoroquinolone resistance protein